MNSNIPFTPRVKNLLSLAQKVAVTSRLNCVGTEHVLIGILQLGGGHAHDLLKAANISPDELLTKVFAIYNAQPKEHTVDQDELATKAEIAETLRRLADLISA